MINETSQPGVTSLEGKKQIIALLKAMSHNEKKTLLKNLKMRNPILTSELLTAGISFHELIELADDQLSILTNHIPSQIMGLALKSASPDLQKKILRIARRKYAEEAFQVMNTPIMDGVSRVERAQDKIMSTATSLFGSKLMTEI